jgi:hypothetical protein
MIWQEHAIALPKINCLNFITDETTRTPSFTKIFWYDLK